MHCWALGGDYGTMPADDAAFVLDAVQAVCDDRALSYTAYPMHEVVAHPAAPDVIRLFAPHLGGPYDPILTPGTPLASRPDWEDVIAAAQECGAQTLWVAFHGYGEEHDRQLNRPGAFGESCLAVHRARDSGLGTGGNVFLTTSMLPDLDRLLAELHDLGLERLAIAPAAYTPTSRGRRYETLRPTLDDLLPLQETMLELSVTGQDVWADLATRTEAGWASRALGGSWPPDAGDELHHRIVCRPNLDLHTGTTGVYRQRHGNLRRDGAEHVLGLALADGPSSVDSIYFPNRSIPDIAELASSCAEPDGTKVYFEAASVRSLWLDRAGDSPA